MKTTGLSKEMFSEHRSELLRLYQFFRLYDVDHSNSLCHDEARLLLKHIGLDPFSTASPDVVQELLEAVDEDNNEVLSFNEFLCLMAKVRVHQKHLVEDQLEPCFWNVATNCGRLDIDKVDEALTAAGQLARTRFEQDLQRKIVYDWDVDSSGDISFCDFADIRQRVQEQIYCHKMDIVVKYAKDLGIEMPKLSEYLWAFDRYDADSNGALCFAEIMRALSFVTIDPPTADELKEIFAQCCVKLEAECPLEEYLQIMQSACEGRVVSEEAEFHIFRLQDVPRQKLCEILTLFPLVHEYLIELEPNDMVDLIAAYLDVAADADLRQDLPKPCANARQLMSYCKRVATSLRAEMVIDTKEDHPPLSSMGGVKRAIASQLSKALHMSQCLKRLSSEWKWRSESEGAAASK